MQSNASAFKDEIYDELAKTAKALGNPHRMEIIDLLAQGPFAVETIAQRTGMTIANTSQHLQVLKNARLVNVTRKGNFIHYHLADKKVYTAWFALRNLGMTHNTTVKKLIEEYRGAYNNNNGVSADELLRKIRNEEIIVLDLRLEEDYKRGHIHNAISIPHNELEKRIGELSKEQEIIAYCCGALCLFVDEAVDLLNKKGYKAARFEEGYPHWSILGYPTVT